MVWRKVLGCGTWIGRDNACFDGHGLKPDEVEDIKGTLRYMINNRFPSGNYPTSEEDKKRDVLVHWCHGAPGVALTLVKAARVRSL